MTDTEGPGRISAPLPAGVTGLHFKSSGLLCFLYLFDVSWESRQMNQRPNELAPCGVFCAACPSFNTTCAGCASDSKEQRRTSKWGCRIRDCCYNIEEKDFCIDCSKFPCVRNRKKLLDTHPGDPKFRYRHEIPEIFTKMKEMGIDNYLEYQRRRWSCPYCGEMVHFYHYKCSECGKEVTV